MRTLRRAALIILLVVAALAVVGWLGIRAYVSSSSARDLAADKLTQVVGLPVTVESLSVGMNSSSLRFKVMEPADGGKPAKEVLSVDSASADVSLTDLATGNVAPTELKLHGLALTLHFDRDGKLLTKMPKSSGGETHIPKVSADDVTLTIQQDGRPDFVLTKAILSATPAGDKLTISGSADDPNWGKWNISGEARVSAGTAGIELQSASAPLKMDLLRSIPFIPEATWKSLQGAGSAAAKIALTLGADNKFGYDVVLKSNGTAQITLPDLEVTLTDVKGTARVHDWQVDLTDVTGTLAGGTVRASGNANLSNEPSVFKFVVSSEKVDVEKLPAEWHLPKQFGGKLRGRADLEILLHKDGKIEPRGTGNAVLDGATVLGEPADVRFRLRSDGKRFRFDREAPPAPGPKTKMSGANPFRSDSVVVGPIRRTVTAQKPAEAPAAKKDDSEPTTLDATVTLRDVDVAELLTRLNVKLPYRLGGKITVQATVTVPVAQADNTKTYRVVGKLTSPEARFEELSVKDFSARVEYAKGVLKLTELHGTLPGTGAGGSGSFTGTATAAVDPRGDLSAALVLDRIPLDQMAKAIPGGGIDLRGSLSGRADFRAPLNQLSDAATWVASAEVSAGELGVFGRTIRSVDLKLKADKGKATLSPAKAVIEGLPLSAVANLDLTRPYKFSGNLKTTSLTVADIRKLVAEASLPFAVEGSLDVTANVSGALSPFVLNTSGEAKATNLKIGPSEGNKIAVKWDLDKDRVKLTDLTASLFGGSVNGSADVPLDTTKSGKFAIGFKDLDSGLAAKAVPDIPVRVTGLVSGHFNAGIPAAKAGQSRAIAADLDLTAPKLTVQGIPAERLSGKVAVTGGVAAYQLEGKALGGSFEVKGHYPSQPKAAPGAERGSLRIRELDLRRLAGVFKVESLQQLRGRVDLAVTFADDFSDGSGQISIRGLGLGDQSFSPGLTGAIRVQNGFVTLSDFNGTFTGGELRGHARVEIKNPRHNYVSLAVDRADSARLFAAVPQLAGSITGSVSAVFRGRLGGESRGSGTVTFDRGTLFGFDATDLRIPFEVNAGTGGFGELTVRGASAGVAQGRLTGDLSYHWDVTSRLSGQIRATQVRLKAVLGEESSYFGNGRLTGRFDFGGNNVRSANDITGTVSASLNQTSVREIPIFSQLTPYLSTAGATSPFQAGEVRGRLGNGVFRLERLALSSASSRLFAEGNVTLAGRLDLDVVAATGQVGFSDRGLRLIGLRLPTLGPIPLSLIRDVSDFLSNQTVRLHVGGSVRQPSVQINTAALLSEEAVRFFLSRYLPGAAALYPADPFAR